jgi:heptosyltransferase-2
LKILVIQTAFIGDVILATPVLEALHKLYPSAVIDVLVRNGNESLLANFTGIRNVFIWDKKVNKTKNLFSLIGKIRNERYDEIINLQRFFSTGLMTVSGGSKRTTGFSKNPLSLFFTNRYKHSIGDKKYTHETERNLSLLAHHGWTEKLRPSLFPSAADRSFVEQYKNGAYVCMAPTSVWFTKQLPAEQWQKLIRLLLRKNTNLFDGWTR